MIDDVFLFLFTNVFTFVLELSDENGFVIARDSKTSFLFGPGHITSVKTLIHLSSVDITRIGEFEKKFLEFLKNSTLVKPMMLNLDSHIDEAKFGKVVDYFILCEF